MNAELGNPAPVHLLEPLVVPARLTPKFGSKGISTRTKSMETAESEIQRHSSGCVRAASQARIPPARRTTSSQRRIIGTAPPR